MPGAASKSKQLCRLTNGQRRGLPLPGAQPRGLARSLAMGYAARAARAEDTWPQDPSIEWCKPGQKEEQCQTGQNAGSACALPWEAVAETNTEIHAHAAFHYQVSFAPQGQYFTPCL